MNQNAPTIPCGEFAVLVKYSTKGWGQVSCIGSLRLDGPGLQSLRVIPPTSGRPSNGYPAEASVSPTFDHRVEIQVRQLTGDKRVMSIRRKINPESPTHWLITLSNVRDQGPLQLVVYPELEKLLEYLISVR